MKVPVLIPIAGIDIKIEYPDLMVDDDGTSELRGETVEGECLIRISKTKNRSVKEVRATLLHEILHAAIEQTGHGQWLLAAGENHEESLVYALENSLASVLNINESNKKIKWREVKFPWEKKA